MKKEDLRWSEEDTRAVEEYKKKFYAGEIKVMTLDEAMYFLKNLSVIS